MLAQKLRIKEGMSLSTINAPSGFAAQIQSIIEITINSKTNKFDQLHWFVNNKAQLEKEVEKVLKLLKNDIICWCYYPKRTSKIQTDLTRDKGWEVLLQHDIQWLSLISFDDTWSTFAFRLKTEEDKKREQKPIKREIFNYVDPTKKIVNLPDDFAAILNKHKTEEHFFNQLSFSNKKEYVEWIVSAKREETRNKRLLESIERLSKKWKNPANR
jgi:hypothetical protein